jgi:hypothetical protein
MIEMPKKTPGPKPGAKIKKLTDRDKFVAKRDKGLTGGRWEVIRGKRVWVKD